jgi:MoaA/NifB/PqqE/SkfB family radical SAM enzyme
MSGCRPKQVRIEASTACQLRCPACATAQGKTAAGIGVAFLKPAPFRTLLTENTWIEEVELSNWGEIFLNPDLSEIIKIAHEQHVVLTAGNGTNFNNVSSDVLEALVVYGFRHLTIALDGATEETYRIYRHRGSFEQVIDNIKALNRVKHSHNSIFPKLTWQFIPFLHNEHEIPKAHEMAQELGMEFRLKLAWDDLFDATEEFAPVRDKALVRQFSSTGVADRKEYFDKHGENFLQKSICSQLWRSPQINWDGRLLGCCINYWGDFGNVFEQNFERLLAGESMSYAKQMLLGEADGREDIPCSVCKHYLTMRDNGRWLTPEDVSA